MIKTKWNSGVIMWRPSNSNDLSRAIPRNWKFVFVLRCSLTAHSTFECNTWLSIEQAQYHQQSALVLHWIYPSECSWCSGETGLCAHWPLDFWMGTWMHGTKAILQMSKRMSSSSQFLRDPGGIVSHPVVFPCSFTIIRISNNVGQNLKCVCRPPL